MIVQRDGTYTGERLTTSVVNMTWKKRREFNILWRLGTSYKLSKKIFKLNITYVMKLTACNLILKHRRGDKKGLLSNRWIWIVRTCHDQSYRSYCINTCASLMCLASMIHAYARPSVDWFIACGNSVAVFASVCIPYCVAASHGPWMHTQECCILCLKTSFMNFSL